MARPRWRPASPRELVAHVGLTTKHDVLDAVHHGAQGADLGLQSQRHEDALQAISERQAREGITMHKAVIVINDWKLPIFERHLMQSGYVFKKRGHACAGL